MSSVIVGFFPHTGQSGFHRSFTVVNSMSMASKSSSRPTRGLPTPVMSLMASPACGARGHGSGRGRLGKQASVTGTLLAGKEHGGLPVELVDRPVDQWFAEHLGGVVHQISNGEVVRTV